MNESLKTLTDDEWESLCDCCGICCLYKFTDADTGELFYTEVMCPLMDIPSAHCTAYAERFSKSPTCRKISPESLPDISRWLPRHCAYRCLYEGRCLPAWHPLNSDASPEAAALREKLDALDLRPWQETLTPGRLRRILSKSRHADPHRNLTRQMIRNVIEDELV